MAFLEGFASWRLSNNMDADFCVAARPVHDGDEVEEAAPHRDVSDIGGLTKAANA